MFLRYIRKFCDMQFNPSDPKIIASKIVSYLESNSDDKLKLYLKDIETLPFFSLSLILNQIRKTNNYKYADYFVSKLEMVEYNNLKSVCALVSFSKTFNYNRTISLKLMDSIKQNNLSEAQISARDISNIIGGLNGLEITKIEAIELIEFLHDSVILHLKEFNSLDRAAIFFGLRTYLSPKILEIVKSLIVVDERKGLKELIFICSYLSHNPLHEFMYIFDITEKILLEDHEKDLKKVFIRVVHAFAKLDKGSTDLHIFFINKFLEIYDTLDINTRGVFYQSVYKFTNVPKDLFKKVDECLKKDWNKLNTKHESVIKFYRDII